jgi:hypothetical protein
MPDGDEQMIVSDEEDTLPPTFAPSLARSMSRLTKVFSRSSRDYRLPLSMLNKLELSCRYGTCGVIIILTVFQNYLV